MVRNTLVVLKIDRRMAKGVTVGLTEVDLMGIMLIISLMEKEFSFGIQHKILMNNLNDLIFD